MGFTVFPGDALEGSLGGSGGRQVIVGGPMERVRDGPCGESGWRGSGSRAEGEPDGRNHFVLTNPVAAVFLHTPRAGQDRQWQEGSSRLKEEVWYKCGN